MSSAVLSDTGLGAFHPAVRSWFDRRFPNGPTEAQAYGWPCIAAGQDTLIAAPTGSGKTLAAFLVAIDQLYRAADRGQLSDETQVVYVSPLKALAVDIQQNLERPLCEIAEVALDTTLVRAWPSMQTGEAAAPLLELASAVLGRPIVASERGGASDASHMAVTIPLTVDGLGPRGGGAHTPNEWVSAESLLTRAEVALAVVVALLDAPRR